MKYKLHKFLLTLLAVTPCVWATAQEPVVTVHLCDETEPFLFGCKTFDHSGIFSGIDVGGTLTTLQLSFGNTARVSYTDTITIGESYLFGCKVITPTIAGESSYKDTLTTLAGCDSIVTLTLHTLDTCHTVAISYSDTITLGESYLFGCKVITPTIAGESSYKDSLTTVAGCDSIVTLKLYVKDSCQTVYVSYSDTITLGESYLFGCEAITPTAVGDTTLVDSLTTVAGCDSIVTLNLYVKDSCHTARISYCDTITIGKTYLFGCEAITPTAVGDTTLVDSLTTVAGCDSIVTLTLHTLDTCHTVAISYSDTISLGETYLFGCEVITPTTTGDSMYVDSLTTVAGCDSIVTLTLHTLDTCQMVRVSYSDTITIGETYLFGCDTITPTAVGDTTLVDSLTTVADCDSIVTLTLHVEDSCHTVYVSYSDTITLGETYLFGCDTITPTAVGDTTLVDSLTTVAGCDSIVTLTLHVEDSCQPVYVSYSDTIILGETYLFGCEAITPTAVGDTTLVDSLTTVAGCDSIVTLNLYVKDSCHTARISYCDTITIGKTYLFGCEAITPTAVGDTTLVDSLTTVAGCDSIITLNLHIKDSCHMVRVSYSDTITIGETYLFGCDTITPTAVGDTTLVDSLTTVAGCDSIVTLNLYVKDSCHTVYVSYTDTITLGETYLFGCDTITPTAVGDTTLVDSLTTVADCDSIVTLNLYVKDSCQTVYVSYSDTITIGETYLFGCDTIVPTSVGDTTLVDSLVSIAGCDSIVTLKLHVLSLEPRDTTIYDTICYATDYVHRLDTLTNLTKDTTFTDTVSRAVQLSSRYYLDSLYTYNIMVRPTYVGITDGDTICASGLATYTWEGESFTMDELTKTKTLTSVSGCDSVVTFTLTINPSYFFSYNDTITLGKTYLFGCDTMVSTSVGDTTLVDSLVSIAGCDSIVTLKLHVLSIEPLDTTIYDTICYATDYVHRLDTLYNLTKDTTFTDTVSKAVQIGSRYYCDSLYIYNIKVHAAPTTEKQDTVILCYGGNHTWREQVINAPGTYYDTLRTSDNRCDSIYYSLYAFVHSKPTVQQDTSILCYGDSYTWLGHETKYPTVLSVAGIYYDTLLTADLRCDSIYYELHLKIHNAPTTAEQDTIILCYGETATWHEQMINASGIYNDTLRTSDNRCDSIYYSTYVFIHAAPTTEKQDTVILCYGGNHTWREQVINASGVYYDTLRTSDNHCDSIYYSLCAFVYGKPTVQQDTSILCYGDSYTWLGHAMKYPSALSEAGIYYDTLLTADLRCDSIYYELHLKIHDEPTTIQQDSTLCYGDSYTWSGHAMKYPSALSEAGIYYDTLLTADQRCDSIYYELHLDIHEAPIAEKQDTFILCYGETATWHEQMINASGIYNDTLRTSDNRCDSIYYSTYVFIHAAPTTEKQDTFILCYGETATWHEQMINASGFYYDTLRTADNRCDSIYYTLYAFVHGKPTTEKQDTFILCYGETDTWRGQVINASGFYYDTLRTSDNRCDSIYYSAYALIHASTETITEDTVLCVGDVINWRGQTVDGSQQRYTDILSTRDGKCDSVIYILNVNVHSLYLDNLPACVKYDNWLLMLDRPAIYNTFGLDPTADQVTWYRIQGEQDQLPDGETDDVLVGYGYYYSTDKVLTDDYYAIIEAENLDSINKCLQVARTVVLRCKKANAMPRLIPTLVGTDQPMTLSDLDDQSATTITIYNAAGSKVRQLSSQGSNAYNFSAENISGIYLMLIKNETQTCTIKFTVIDQ